MNKHIIHFDELGLVNSTALKAYIGTMLHIVDTGQIPEDTQLSIKYDGSPSIVLGTNPENGKFFVATKGLFNKKPKLAHSPEELETLYGHSEELLSKMKYLWHYFSAIKDRIPNIIQGDLLFTPASKYSLSNNFKMVYRPNIITYEFLDLTVQHIGVAFHTSYFGDSLTSLYMDSRPKIPDLNTLQILSVDTRNFIQVTKGEKLDVEPIVNSLMEYPQPIDSFVNYILKSDYTITDIDDNTVLRLFEEYKQKNPQFAAISDVKPYMEYFRACQKFKIAFMAAFKTPNVNASISVFPVSFEGMVMKIDGYPAIKLVDRDIFSFENFAVNG